MFVLYEMTRMVRVDPKYLLVDRKDAVTDELNRLLSNKVIVDVGLCMALWDIKKIGMGMSFPGDGGVHTEVVFRFLVFRPFQDEIIVGKIKNNTREGVHVTLGFFDDILIPPEALQYPSRFEEREQAWVWEYSVESEDGQVQKHDMLMHKGQQLKFRVIGELFDDCSTVPAAQAGGGNTSSSSSIPTAGPSSASQSSDNSSSRVPYCLTASINEPGLGLLSWWS